MNYSLEMQKVTVLAEELITKMSELRDLLSTINPDQEEEVFETMTFLEHINTLATVHAYTEAASNAHKDLITEYYEEELLN